MKKNFDGPVFDILSVLTADDDVAYYMAAWLQEDEEAVAPEMDKDQRATFICLKELRHRAELDEECKRVYNGIVSLAEVL